MKKLSNTETEPKKSVAYKKESELESALLLFSFRVSNFFNASILKSFQWNISWSESSIFSVT